MGVLLLVAREVTCVSPHQVQQPEGNVGRTVSRVELRAWEEVEMREVVGGGGGEEEWVVSLLSQVLQGELYLIASVTTLSRHCRAPSITHC